MTRRPRGKRMRIPPTRSSALALLVLLTGTPAAAFVLQSDNFNGTLGHPRWAPGSMPVTFRLNDTPFDLLPNFARGSMPLDAIQAALRAWSLAPVRLALDGTTPI